MKIQCDVCNKMQASLFCTADEAALCSACDLRVHHSNKLASKHHRFSLNHANSLNNSPLCDICLERRGFVFCQQDRAIVCKECDFYNHDSNEHTKNHSRFLLSGIKLLPPASTSSPPPFSPAPPTPASIKVVSNEETGTGFTISEYLINTIPGWKFEEFFDSPSSVPFDQFQNHVGEVNADSDPENMVSFLGGIRVPQAPTSSLYYASNMDNRSSSDTNIKLFSSSSSSLRDDNNFTVPQMIKINPPY